MMTATALDVAEAQLAVLQKAFPDWLIVLAAVAGESWLEATRRSCTGNCACTLVAGTAGRMRQLLISASAPAVP